MKRSLMFARIAVLASCALAAQAIAKEGDQTREFKNGCKITCVGGDWSQSESGLWSCSSRTTEKSPECPVNLTSANPGIRNPRIQEGALDAEGNVRPVRNLPAGPATPRRNDPPR